MKRFQTHLVTVLFFTPLALIALGSEGHKSVSEKPVTDVERQNATTRDIGTIATAILMYSVDKNAYPGPTQRAEEVGSFLKGKLEPTYVRNLPVKDGWGRPFWYLSNGTEYTLVSYGKDGIPDAQRGGATASFDCDIIFANGAFFQWPSGTQT
jgi:hypothetical protein